MYFLRKSILPCLKELQNSILEKTPYIKIIIKMLTDKKHCISYISHILKFLLPILTSMGISLLITL
jgi:hypothetical protein